MTERTIHVCDDCAHPADEHNGSRCSYGWCPCRRTHADVNKTGRETTVTVRPGYNQTTGRWGE